MIKRIKAWYANWIAKIEEKNKPVGYLGRDMAKHRVHSTKYEDLCK